MADASSLDALEAICAGLALEWAEDLLGEPVQHAAAKTQTVQILAGKSQQVSAAAEHIDIAAHKSDKEGVTFGKQMCPGTC